MYSQVPTLEPLLGTAITGLVGNDECSRCIADLSDSAFSFDGDIVDRLDGIACKLLRLRICRSVDAAFQRFFHCLLVCIDLATGIEEYVFHRIRDLYGQLLAGRHQRRL